jgi:biotin operon repressor
MRVKNTSGEALHRKCVNKYMSYLHKNLMEIEKSKKGYSNNKVPFFVIYCSFLDKLKMLSNEAIKLYVYYGLKIDYKEGCCEFDTHYDCKKLDIPVRRFKSRIKELIINELILIHEEDGNKYLFISPYNSEIKYSHMDNKDDLSRTYRGWIKESKGKDIDGKRIPFFFLPQTFMEYWSKLSTAGAITLYIYCGITMNKEFGFLYKSLETIGEDLGVTKKTLCLWFKDLENAGLIIRHQRGLNMSSCTHLIPSISITSKHLRRYRA